VLLTANNVGSRFPGGVAEIAQINETLTTKNSSSSAYKKFNGWAKDEVTIMGSPTKRRSRTVGGGPETNNLIELFNSDTQLLFI
jgi:hypothetical protein